ncbi:unnamed protein product [Zymoseptoria tritici ST99CH_3D7]|uniref:Rhodopsin domain-containing protein n=1 Tax=Zymoseptoria tritici (strain ST99CH_3D7) TaxID=1276538 RepID=A0A1X7RDU2_ZYMT9|nr:unnamed protein product [Zymoseptoria tritici ST99CH_3D7]
MAQRTANMDSVLRNQTTEVESSPIMRAMPQEQLAVIVVGAIFTLIGLFANLCRTITLLQRRRGLWWDDFAAFAAFTFFIGFAAAAFVAVRWGVGLPTSDIPTGWASRAIQAGYAMEMLYFFSIFCVKMSVLLLYLRLARKLRDIIYQLCIGLSILLAIFFFTTIIVAAAQCVPTHKYWSPDAEGHCIDVTAFFYATNIFTIVTDLAMLALSIPLILKAKRQRSQNVGIIVAILTGALSVTASCARLHSIVIYDFSREPLRDAAPIYIWSFIEISAGMCCASMAVIVPLFTAYSVRISAIISPIGPSNQMVSFANYAEAWPYGRNGPMGKYVPAAIQGQSRRTTQDLTDLSPPHTINGRPIRISKPLPELPKACFHEEGLTALPQSPAKAYHRDGTLTALPQRSNQPMLHAIAMHNAGKMDPAAPVYGSRVREREVQEWENTGLFY